MLVSFNPNIQTQKYPNFKALPVKKLSTDIMEAEIFRIRARGGSCPNTQENARDLLTSINQADDIEIKGLLTDIAQNVWHILKK